MAFNQEDHIGYVRIVGVKIHGFFFDLNDECYL
jgi:hypothetical protein